MAECYCAKIENGVVDQVIVCSSETWAATHLGGTWLCAGEKPVGVGWIVISQDGSEATFAPPQPFPSWTLNGDTSEWVPPSPCPGDGKFYNWDETSQSWVELP